MLKRAEPPICVGLYARWGSGKTFMISLLKEEFDQTVREDPGTRQLLQFFEEGYADAKAKNGPADDPKTDEVPTVISLLFDLLRIIMFSFIPTVPYGVTTFRSIIYDALRQASRKAWNWCSKLQRSCKPKAKTNIKSGDGDKDNGKASCWCVAGLYQKLTGVDDEDQEIKKEFIFVHFNAWECAACLSFISYRHHIVPDGEYCLTSHIDHCPQVCPV